MTTRQIKADNADEKIKNLYETAFPEKTNKFPGMT